MSLYIEYIGGNCPVQSEGTYYGRAFYFRARGETMQMHIATNDTFTKALADDAAWYFEEDFGDGKFQAGWAEAHECLAFMARAFAAWNEAHPAGGTA